MPCSSTPSRSRPRTAGPLVVLASLLACAAPGLAQSEPPTGFSNPPLRYEGPDPTADYFLPSNSAMPFSTIPGPETITPLPPPEFPTTPSATTRTGTTPSATMPSAAIPPAGTTPARSDQGGPRRLTPSSLMRSFSLPGLLPPGQILPEPAGTTPGLVLPRGFGMPGGEGELVYPAEGLDAPGTSFWPSDDLEIDPLELHNGGITEHKNGFFQSIGVTSTWIDRNDKPDDFGLTELDIKATFALPLPSRDWPLLLTPAFNTRFLDGPQVVDLPPRLYETYFDFTWVPRLSARWTAIIGVAPSIYSDFQNSTDGFRVTGKGLMRYDWRPGQVQVLLGVLYLGRDDVAILPAGGVIWTPSDRQKYELLFPRPKLSHLIRREARFEDWLYLGAEFGGNSYSIERIPGTSETITLRDYRAYVGLERKLNGGAGFRLEIGYVAGRVIEFSSGLPDLEADETAMIRGGITF